MGKLLRSTFSERKIMSTKTSIKRIAAVAAVALTLGGFSAVSAHAAGTYTISGTGVASPYKNAFQPSGIVHGTASSTSASTATAVSENATGWAVTQSSSGAGYTTLVPGTDDLSASGVSSVSANFTGASSVTATPASQVCVLTQAGTPNTVVPPSTVTVTYSAASVSGTNVSFAANSAGTLFLKSADVAAYAIGAGKTAIIAANPAYDTVVCSGTGTDASIKVSAVTAGTVTATAYVNSIGYGVSTSTPVELFNITILAGSGAATFSSVKVVATSNINGQFLSTNTAGTAWVAKSSDSTDLKLSTFVYNTAGKVSTNALLSPALTYSVTGVGLLSSGAATGGTGASGSTYLAVPASTYVASLDDGTAASNVAYLISDGRSGTSTVTVAANGVAVGTITVVFYGKVASISVAPNYTIARAGNYAAGWLQAGTTGQLDTPVAVVGGDKVTLNNDNAAVIITLKDANGTVVPAASGLKASSDNGAVILSGITAAFVDNGTGIYTSGFGVIHTVFTSAVASTSGQSANVTYSYTNSDGTVISATPVKFTVGGKVAKTVLTTDAATYEPGAPMVVTQTATDASGNPVFDGAPSATLTPSKSLGGDMLANFNGFFVGGVDASAVSLAKAKTYAPVTPGTFTLVGTDSALNALSVTATVNADSATTAATAATAASQAAVDAANEATDAANAATDAANNAMDSADAAQQAALDAGDKADAALAAVTDLATKVSAIATQIAALSALVKKIAAKVKA
jgi:hypothetical protein